MGRSHQSPTDQRGSHIFSVSVHAGVKSRDIALNAVEFGHGIKGKQLREFELKQILSGAAREAFLPLLLLADDSEQQVRSYMNEGTLYAFGYVGSEDALGMVLAIPEPDGSVELKAVAVAEGLHGQGIGSKMLRAVIQDLHNRGTRHLIVGTGNSGIGQLAFYQKAGFRLWKIERDFFSAERGYADDLEENGIPLLDMVWMDQELTTEK
jgi:ribosomal protein S18 acetylase RimI-like enzyme